MKKDFDWRYPLATVFYIIYFLAPYQIMSWIYDVSLKETFDFQLGNYDPLWVFIWIVVLTCDICLATYLTNKTVNLDSKERAEESRSKRIK